MGIKDAIDAVHGLGQAIYNFVKERHTKKEIQEKFNDNVLRIMINKLYEEDGLEGIRITRNHCDTYLKVKKKEGPMKRIQDHATAKAPFSKETEHTPAIKGLIDYFEIHKLDDRTHIIKAYCLNKFKEYKKNQRDLEGKKDESEEQEEEESEGEED